MPSSSDVLALVDAQSRSRQTIADKVLAYLYWLWSGFDGWYSPRLVEEAAAQAWVAVAAAQAATAGITDDYLARTSSIMRGTPVPPAGVPASMRESLRHGVTGPEVQARVAKEMRWQVYRNEPVETALERALQRAGESVSQDLALAVQRQAAHFGEVRKVRTFMRVTRGENTCGLCFAASNKLYYRRDLMPIHAKCRCTVLEVSPQTARDQRKKGVTGRDDDGEYMSLSDEDYKRLTGVSRTLYGRDLKDVRYVIDEHGELGPVLRNVRQREKTLRRLPDGSYETTGGKTSETYQGTRKDKVPVPRQDRRTPEQKRLTPEHNIADMSPRERERAIGMHTTSLAWAKENNLPEQVAYHSKRLSLLRAAEEK